MPNDGDSVINSVTRTATKDIIGSEIDSGLDEEILSKQPAAVQEAIQDNIRDITKQVLNQESQSPQLITAVSELTKETQLQEYQQQRTILNAHPTTSCNFNSKFSSSLVSIGTLVLNPTNTAGMEVLLEKMVNQLNGFIDQNHRQNKTSKYLQKLYSSVFRENKGITKSDLADFLKKHGSKTCNFNIPKNTENWVERRVPLEEFNANFEEKRVVSISGIAGSGKTQLAYRFAHGIKDFFAKAKQKIIIKEFVLYQSSLEKEYREFLKALDLSYLREEDIIQLDKQQLFQEIKDGLDVEYSDSPILLLYDNVDRQEDIHFLNVLLKNDPWFKERSCYLIITSPKENFFNGSLGFEINLNTGLTLAESLVLLKQPEVSDYLIKAGVNLDQSYKAIEEIENFLPELYSLNKTKKIQNEVKSYLSLLQIYDALPLGLLIAKDYIATLKDVNNLIEMVTITNIETTNFIDELSDADFQSIYRKNKGACSQSSAICLLIQALEQDKNFNFTNDFGYKVSDVIQILSFYSYNKIPTVIIDEILSFRPRAKGLSVLTQKFIAILRRYSLIQEFEISSLCKQPLWIFTLHNQTHLAAQIMLSKNDEYNKKHAQKALQVITQFHDKNYLRDKSNFEIQNLLGNHFFHLLHYIAINPKTDIDIKNIVIQYASQIKHYIATNYNVSWPIELLKLIIDDNSKTINDANYFPSLQIKLYENIVDCCAETGNRNYVLQYGQKAIDAFLAMAISQKQVWDNEDVSIVLSIARIYLHMRKYVQAKELLGFPFFNSTQMNSEQISTRSQLLMDVATCENDKTSGESYLAEVQPKFTQLDRAINEFRKGSLLLTKGQYPEAVSVFEQIFRDNSTQILFIDDVFIALLVAYVKSERYVDVINSIENESIKGGNQIQVDYLVCVAHVMNLLNCNLSQTDYITVIKRARESLNFMLKSCKIFPAEIYLLSACIEYYDKKYDNALNHFEKYFAFQRIKFANPLEKYTTIWTRRIFYFIPHSMSLLVGKKLAQILKPYYLYSCSLSESKQFHRACLAIINHFNSEEFDKAEFKIKFNEFLNLAAQAKITDAECIELTEKIKIPEAKDFVNSNSSLFKEKAGHIEAICRANNAAKAKDHKAYTQLSQEFFFAIESNKKTASQDAQYAYNFELSEKVNDSFSQVSGQCSPKNQKQDSLINCRHTPLIEISKQNKQANHARAIDIINTQQSKYEEESSNIKIEARQPIALNELGSISAACQKTMHNNENDLFSKLLLAEQLCKKEKVGCIDAYHILKNISQCQNRIRIANIYCEIAQGLTSSRNNTTHHQKKIITDCYDKALEYAPTDTKITLNYENYLKTQEEYLIKKEKKKLAVEQCRGKSKNKYFLVSEAKKPEDKQKLFIALIDYGDFTNDLDERIASYKEALLLNKGDESTSIKLAISYYISCYRNNYFTEALREFKDSQKNTKNRMVFLWIGLCYAKLGEFQEAKACFNYKIEQNTGMSQYLTALCLLKESQIYSDDIKNKQELIKAAQSILLTLSQQKQWKEENNFLEIYSEYYIKFSEQYLKFYSLYARFLLVYRILEDKMVNQSIYNNLSAYNEEIAAIAAELKKINHYQHNFFVNNSQDKIPNFMLEALATQLKNLKENIGKKSFHESSLYKANQLEAIISSAIQKYEQETTSMSNPDVSTIKFIEYYKLYFIYEEDLFFKNRYEKCCLLLKWYFDNHTASGRLRTDLEGKLKRKNLLSTIYTYKVNEWETRLELAIKEYQSKSRCPSTRSTQFIQKFFEIKFTCNEPQKNSYYKKMLIDFKNIKQDKNSSLMRCLNQFFYEQNDYDKMDSVGMSHNKLFEISCR